MQYLVLSAWCLVRPRSLVRPWSLVHVPEFEDSRTKDQGPRTDQAPGTDQALSTKYQSSVPRQLQFGNRFPMDLVGPVGQANRARVRPRRREAEVARHAGG